jgi:hypothetical protein
MSKAKESRFHHRKKWVESRDRSALVLDVVKFVIIHEEEYGSTNGAWQPQK